MRTLNRPMFRYGGPIKEGVMSGIREPKRGGGSMGNLVGSPLYPKTKGREHHWAVMALPYIGAGLRMAARPFGRWAMQNVPKMFSGPQRNWAIGKGFSSTPGYTKNVAENVFTPNKLGKYLLSSPEGRLVTGGAGYVGSGLLRELLKENYNVTCVDNLMFGGESLLDIWHNKNFNFIKCDINDWNAFSNILKINKFDAVIHLAAIVGDPACQMNSELAIQTNWESTKWLLDKSILE